MTGVTRDDIDRYGSACCWRGVAIGFALGAVGSWGVMTLVAYLRYLAGG